MEPYRGRPKKHELVVNDAQLAELERMARQSRSARSVAFRARIILECAGGASNAAVAAKLRTTGFTVAFGATVSSRKGLLGWEMSRVRERHVRSVTRRSIRWCV